MYLKISKKFSAFSAAFISAMFLLSFIFPNNDSKIHAYNNNQLNYEIKLLLDSNSVLNSEKLLKKEYRDLFGTGEKYTKATAAFFDTERGDFNKNGWINRIRVKENEDYYELTYKRRYEITADDLQGAVESARKDGLDIQSGKFEAEVDWNFSKKNLSVSFNRKVSNKGYGELKLPKKREAVKMLKSGMPEEENNCSGTDWGKTNIDKSLKIGDIHYIKYSGTYKKNKINIEVWTLENRKNGKKQFITELSVKTNDYDKAEKVRKSLVDILEKEGISVKNDSTKTQMILDSYLRDKNVE